MPRKRFAYAVAALAAVAAVAAGMVAAADPAPVGPPTSVGTGGAAATVERLATQAAIDTLRRGGNAVDAAVTAAAVLGVTEPFSCGIGGGGFMLIQENGEKKPITIDSREAGAGGDEAGLFLGERRAASVQLRALQRPLGRRSRHGARAGSGRSRSTARSRSPRRSHRRSRSRATASSSTRPSPTRSRGTSTSSTTSRRRPRSISTRTARPRDVGSVFKNPDLARTYELLAAKGHKGFYRNELAQAIVDTVTHPQVAADANHVWRPGVMTLADLREYTAPQRAATHVTYRGLDVYGMGPPSSGGSTVGEALNILEGFPALGHDPRGGAPSLHRGVPLLVRRPRCVSRRPGLLRRAAARAALEGLRRHPPRADHRDRGGAARPRPATRIRSTTSRGRARPRPRRRSRARRRT